MTKRRKKADGLSLAIVALNIVIVFIIIILIVLIFLHMKDDTPPGSDENTNISESVSEPVSVETSQASVSQPNEENTSVSEPEVTKTNVILPQTYNKDFFSKDLFIGDSIFTGLYMYNYLDSNNVFAAVGLNPESALTFEIDGVGCIKKTETLQPRNIYIMLGTNGLAFMDGNYMAKKLLSLIEALEAACPTAKIYILSIPPVTKAHSAEGAETIDKLFDYKKLKL